MKVIVKPRQGGKTYDLVMRAKNHNGYIVCHSLSEGKRIAGIARDLGIYINHPITYDEFLKGHYGPFCKCFHIDNVDMLLNSVSRLPIETVTLTNLELPKVDTEFKREIQGVPFREGKPQFGDRPLFEGDEL